jgi:glutamine synthetase
MERPTDLARALIEAPTDEAFVRAAVDSDVDFVDLRSTDLLGRWHHVTLPASRLSPELFERGVGFDGSSVPGFKSVEKGDMVLLPDRGTTLIEEIDGRPVLSMIASAAEADSREPFPLDPRDIARRAEEVLAASGHADSSLWSPELEFYLFSAVDYEDAPDGAFYRVQSDETAWADDAEEGPTLGYRIQPRAGYHAIPPCDRHFDLRNEIVSRMESAGIPVKYHHHENGAPGQVEIEVLPEPLLRAADHTMLGKYVVRNTASEWGISATFMPKPLPTEPGNGLHFHIKLTLDGRPVLHGENGYAGLSDEGLHFIGGILSHGRALAALTNPSTNSYRRLRPGFEAPTNLFFSAGNRSAAIRIPQYATSPDAKTIEYRPGDATANPYVAMSALLAAGLDGMERGIDPREHGFGPFDENIHDALSGLRTEIVPIPASLEEALDELACDAQFLTASGIFPQEFPSVWIELKMKEADLVRTRPHPSEYGLYFDC